MEEDNVLFLRSEKKNNDEEASHNDMWDDTALIYAYDDAVNDVKNEIEIRLGGGKVVQHASSSESFSSTQPHLPSTSKGRKPMKENGYSVGDACRCLYSADGKIYEANVIELNESGTCVVRYVGYGNEEEVDVDDLRPSCGQAARSQQDREATLETTVHPPDEEYHNKVRVSKKNPSKSSRHRLNREDPSFNRSRPESRGSIFSSPDRHYASMSMPSMTVPPPPPLNMLHTPGCPEDESDALSAMLMSWYMSGFHTGYYQGMKHGNDQKSAQNHRTSTRKK